MADRVSGGQLHTMGDVRRRLEDQEPSITIRASDPLAVEIMRGIARGLGKNEIESPFLEMAARMQAWLDNHQYELLQTTVLQEMNPLGQCVVMVKIGIGPRRDHPTYRVEHRVTSKFKSPAGAMAALYGGYVWDSAREFGDEHDWLQCDSHGDPIKGCGD